MTGLELISLSKRFGSAVALDRLSLVVPPGAVVGFVGSNGAGKTTAMRIALGVLRPDAGEVRLDGRPLDAAARRWIGYMPEERGLYPKMRVHEQLVHLARLHGLPRSAAERSARDWTERLGVAARRDDAVEALSLGNQQRVQLAAALVHEPAVLVLDEPFSGLDPVAVEVMSDVLRDRRDAGVPVLFSSHQLDLVERLCDRVAVLARGSLVASGTVDELTAGDRARWQVSAPPGTPWPAGAREVRRTGDVAVVELVDGVDEQQVLAAALAAGPVTLFGPSRPALAEVFRDVVAPPAETAA